MDTPCVELRGLSKRYAVSGGFVDAVKSVDLGKTTTIKMICGLIRPTSGEVRIAGLDVQSRRGAAMRYVGAVLEGTRNVHWPLSAWDNLMYFGHIKGLRGKPLRVRAEGLLRRLDLWDRRHDLVGTFSRGMQQKVAIGCALIADPPLVLLDEPTLGLDVQAVVAVRQLIRELVAVDGKTVILTTHQLDMAEALCDRVAVINKGQIVTDQPVYALLDLFREKTYDIRVEGYLSEEAVPRADGVTVEYGSGYTVLRGPLDGIDMLYEVLAQLRSSRVVLLSAKQSEPTLEDVFLRLLAADTIEGA
jgi:ABC-2 type transport system ATP-binding protein